MTGHVTDYHYQQGILAEDLETDGDTTVMYQLQDQPHPLFSINETSGVVTVTGIIDRESNDIHRLTVVAYEGGWYMCALIHYII